MVTKVRVKMTYELAMAAGRDAANRRMRKGGRAAWNEEDWNEACLVFEKLWSPRKENRGRNYGKTLV